MSLSPLTSLRSRGRALRARLAGEAGFTMILAMGTLLVTSLLLAATFVALDGDAHLSQTDLDGKRAYYAARAGVNAYMYQLNQDSTFWQTCSNDTMGSYATVPGSTSGEYYQYNPVPANGTTSCSSTNPVGSMIDTNSGMLTMKFYGKAGTPAMTRGLVASFRRKSPLDYLWYTVYEALDSSISGYTGCGMWYRQGRSSSCNIYWATGDKVNGSMYTQDQFLINTGAAPVFGRTSSDSIQTLASSICGGGCQSAVFNGTVSTGVNVPEPSDNSALATDASTYGKVFSGTTTITLSGTTATVVNCPSSCTTSTVDITKYPIIYVQNASGCSPAAYTPYLGNSYPSSGCTGDVYVSGNYTSSLTLAAANNIIITGNLTTTGGTSAGTPSGSAVLGLVADDFVRVQHSVPTRTASYATCPSGSDLIDLNNISVDAAIMALQHSFIVDNFDCGSSLGNLNLYGSIVQKFRGAVATGTGTTGYLKNYNYDDRLSYLAPPYLFDILTAGWKIARETECGVGSADANVAC